MAKLSQQNHKNTTQNNTSTASNGVTKVKRTRRSVPRDSPPQRSSIYRGVTRQVIFSFLCMYGVLNSWFLSVPNFVVIYAEYCFRHRWTGRYEAHLWDKNCWNESQNKKGRQGSLPYFSFLFLIDLNWLILEADEGFFFFSLLPLWLLVWWFVVANYAPCSLSWYV